MSIFCYILNLDTLYDEQIYYESFMKLPNHGIWKNRRENILRYKFKEDRIRSLGVGLLLLHILKKHGKENSKIKFNEFGKLYITDDEFQFNLSHSGNYAVCSFGLGSNGVDIEQYQKCDYDIAKSFFDQREYALIKEVGDTMFTRIWTLKESYIKAVGKGLSIPLDSFYVCPGKSKELDTGNAKLIHCTSDSSYIENDRSYNFKEFILNTFHITVCSKSDIDTTINFLESLSV
jgi:4'-phosphopantetheinyl transferase